MISYAFLIPTTLFLITNAKNIINFISKAKENTSAFREIYKTVSWNTMADFCIFKIRTNLSSYFETGLLSKGSKVCNLVYYDGSSKYLVCFPKTRGPCPFSQVNEYGIDVTEKIREFSGPSHNFHGIPTTPEMLGFDKLTFIYKNGMEKDFEKKDTISLTPPVPPDIPICSPSSREARFE